MLVKSGGDMLLTRLCLLSRHLGSELDVERIQARAYAATNGIDGVIRNREQRVIHTEEPWGDLTGLHS